MKFFKWRPLAITIIISGLFSFTLISNSNMGNSPMHSTVAAAPGSAAVTYVVDVQKSTVTWTAKKYTGSHTGNVALSGGSILADKNLFKGGSFTIDTRSITNTDIKEAEGNAKLIGHLKSDDFFGVEKFPEANLAITSVTPKGNNRYDITGNLTIKGKTNPVSFPATIAVDNKQVKAIAKITIDRSKYDIKFRSQSFFENLGDKVIYDNFDLDIVLVATVK